MKVAKPLRQFFYNIKMFKNLQNNVFVAMKCSNDFILLQT